MNRYLPVLGLGLVLFVACSSSSDDHAPAVEAGGESSSGGRGGSSSRAGSSSGGDAGSSEAGNAGSIDTPGGAAGESGEGGAAGLEPGMVIPVLPGTCSETTEWKGATSLATVSSAADERLLSITVDELDIIFLRDGALYRAHRNASTEAFGAAALVTVPAGYDTAYGATLSADGKTLVLVASSGQAFASISRTSRTAAFGATADASAFQALNSRSIQTMEHYLAPVLSPDGKSLMFAAFMPPPQGGFPVGQTGVSVVYESYWVGGVWAMPNNVSHDLFEGTSFERMLPTGISSDSRTLFYFDEGLAKEQARFRDRADAPLYTLIDLGMRDTAVPNADCTALYYSGDGNVLVDKP